MQKIEAATFASVISGYPDTFPFNRNSGIRRRLHHLLPARIDQLL